MLATKKIYFLRNTKWDDPFEAFLIKRYCTAQSEDFDLLNSDKYFLCCTTKPERDHFWRNYTPNKDGAMVTFNLSILRSLDPRILGRVVSYPPRDEIKDFLKKIDTGSVSEAELKDLYFIKRMAFEDEKEYRLLIQDKPHVGDTIGIDFVPQKTITRILFDPRMDTDTFSRHKLFLEDQFGDLNVRHSRLYNPDKSFPEKRSLTTRSTLTRSPRRASRR